MLPSLIEFLEHIQQQAAYIVRRSKDLDYDTFLNHDDLPRAFERSLEIIGEATKQLPPDFTTQYSNIQWRGMARLRDRLIHHYFGTDYEVLWEIVANDLPQLHENIADVIDDVKNGGYTPQV